MRDFRPRPPWGNGPRPEPLEWADAVAEVVVGTTTPALGKAVSTAFRRTGRPVRGAACRARGSGVVRRSRRPAAARVERAGCRHTRGAGRGRGRSARAGSSASGVARRVVRPDEGPGDASAKPRMPCAKRSATRATATWTTRVTSASGASSTRPEPIPAGVVGEAEKARPGARARERSRRATASGPARAPAGLKRGGGGEDEREREAEGQRRGQVSGADRVQCDGPWAPSGWPSGSAPTALCVAQCAAAQAMPPRVSRIAIARRRTPMTLDLGLIRDNCPVAGPALARRPCSGTAT